MEADITVMTLCIVATFCVVVATDLWRLPELVAYQFEIAMYARKYKWPSWVVYDMNYQRQAATRPSLPRAEAAGPREAKFFSQCFTGTDKIQMKHGAGLVNH